MHLPLFLRIVSTVEGYDLYFIQQGDALWVLSLSPLQKVRDSYHEDAHLWSSNEFSQ